MIRQAGALCLTEKIMMSELAESAGSKSSVVSAELDEHVGPGRKVRRVHYAKGLTTGDIQKNLGENLRYRLSQEPISKITGKVLEEMQGPKSRPLERGRFPLAVAES